MGSQVSPRWSVTERRLAIASSPSPVHRGDRGAEEEREHNPRDPPVERDHLTSPPAHTRLVSPSMLVARLHVRRARRIRHLNGCWVAKQQPALKGRLERPRARRCCIRRQRPSASG